MVVHSHHLVITSVTLFSHSNLASLWPCISFIGLQRYLGWKGPLVFSNSLMCKAGPNTKLHQLPQLLIQVYSGMGIKWAESHLFCLHAEFSCIRANCTFDPLALWWFYSMCKTTFHISTSERRDTSRGKKGKISFLDICEHCTWLTLSSLYSQLRGKGIVVCDSLTTLNVDLTIMDHVVEMPVWLQWL